MQLYPVKYTHLKVITIITTTLTIYLNLERHSLMTPHFLVRFDNCRVAGELISNWTSASARHRASPYELVSFEKAMDMIFHEVQPLSMSKQPVSASIRHFGTRFKSQVEYR
jgi:hypothetical protein